MPQTIAQKIIAAHCGLDTVEADDIVTARLDLVTASELSAVTALAPFDEIGANRVFDTGRIVIVPDHFTPNKDIATAEICRRVREFARKYKIKNYIEVGRGGIGHVLVPAMGFVRPGNLVAGADSHTTAYGALNAMAVGIGSTDLAAAWATGEMWFRVPKSVRINLRGKLRKWVSGYDVGLACIRKIGTDGARYRSVEVGGDGLAALTMADRLAFATLLAETGAKAAIMDADEVTAEYLSRHAKNVSGVRPDADAEYLSGYDVDLGDLDMQVAQPPSPANAAPASEVGDVKLDQVVIGFCTAGRIEEMRVAAQVLRGRKVHPDVRLLVIPGSQEVVLQAIEEGIVADLIAAGAAVSTPTCGPCIGGHMGVLAAGEKCLVTASRNFQGRMGHKTSEIYLAGPAVAAASAIAGRITTPDKL